MSHAPYYHHSQNTPCTSLRPQAAQHLHCQTQALALAVALLLLVLSFGIPGPVQRALLALPLPHQRLVPAAAAPPTTHVHSLRNPFWASVPRAYSRPLQAASRSPGAVTDPATPGYWDVPMNPAKGIEAKPLPASAEVLSVYGHVCAPSGVLGVRVDRAVSVAPLRCPLRPCPWGAWRCSRTRTSTGGSQLRGPRTHMLVPMPRPPSLTHPLLSSLLPLLFAPCFLPPSLVMAPAFASSLRPSPWPQKWSMDRPFRRF